MLCSRLWGMMLAFTLFSALVVTGCHKTQPPPVAPNLAPPADAQTLTMIRQNVRSIDPGAQVGLVMAVKTESRLAAVGGMDTKIFHEGQVLTFMDSNQNSLVNGTIVNIADGFLNIRYEAPYADRRAPREGDLAVHFSK